MQKLLILSALIAVGGTSFASENSEEVRTLINRAILCKKAEINKYARSLHCPTTPPSDGDCPTTPPSGDEKDKRKRACPTKTPPMDCPTKTPPMDYLMDCPTKTPPMDYLEDCPTKTPPMDYLF